MSEEPGLVGERTAEQFLVSEFPVGSGYLGLRRLEWTVSPLPLLTPTTQRKGWESEGWTPGRGGEEGFGTGKRTSVFS